ncbi:MAG TPA: hypothetical protein VGM81_25805 [Burkholderiaceae bacterium]|jgi:hypothetical protein
MKPAAADSFDFTDMEAMHRVVKAIIDFDDTVRLMLERLPRTKPWHRLLAAQLQLAEREIQILRMTISLERGADEVFKAAHALCRTSRDVEVSVRGSRADLVTQQSIQLLVSMGAQILGVIEHCATLPTAPR